MRIRHLALLAASVSVAAFVACTLNPQPLPPRDEFGGESSFADSGARSDSGGFGGTGPDVPSADAATGTPNLDSEGGADDGGDSGTDGGDGATDASDDGG